MATLPVATLPGERDFGNRARTRRFGIRLALPLLVAFAALLGMPGVALAGGAPGAVTIAVDPAAGPVGTQVTVKGSSLPPSDSIAIGYSAGNCSSGVTIISGAKGSVKGDGTLTIVYVWPATGTGNYTICVIDQTNGHTYPSTNHFTVTSTTPPSISVSTPVNSGKPVTVTGAGFLIPGGGTVEILDGPSTGSSCGTSEGTASLNADGSFTFTFNAPFESKDTQITITAVYPQGACNGSWILRASKTVTVLAAPAAVTPSPSPSPSAAPAVTPTTTTTTPVGIVFPPSFPPTAAESVVYCLVGLLVLLLLLLLFLLLSRRRNQDKPVTIKQQDKPVVNSGGGQGGAPMVQSSIYAENPRNQRRTQIAEEVTTIQEEPVNPPTPPNNGPFNQSPRFGPASGGQ